LEASVGKRHGKGHKEGPLKAFSTPNLVPFEVCIDSLADAMSEPRISAFRLALRASKSSEK
jgi:hypothetical protein